MLKNIIFDLGNVLLSFRPDEFLEKKNFPAVKKEVILNDIFSGNEWLLLDQGLITTSEAIESIAAKSLLDKTEIRKIFDMRTELLHPLETNAALLPALLKQGYRLFFLSNFPIDIFDEVRDGYDFFDHFEGGLISAEARISKPDPGIYNMLLDKYSLKAEECLFIDDSAPNISTAIEIGMRGLFTGGSRDISPLLAAELNKIMAG